MKEHVEDEGNDGRKRKMERRKEPEPTGIDSDEETQEKEIRRLFDEMARDIGREAIKHLKTMYPAALAAVPRGAEVSLVNRIRSDINLRMRPLLMAMIAMYREWDEELGVKD